MRVEKREERSSASREERVGVPVEKERVEK